MYHNNKKGSLCFSLAAGVFISIFMSMDVSAQVVDYPEALARCSEATNDSKAQSTCLGCVLFYMSTNTDNPDLRCKDYLSLNKPIDPKPVPVETLNPEELEQEVAELMARCDKSYSYNCQCWEEEYRASRANGLDKFEAVATSACYSRDRIKAYIYPVCVRTQWKMIEQFESYCGCVAADTAESIIEHGELYKNTAQLDAAKACELSKQERLTPERGKERYEQYGRRGPSLDITAYKKVL